MELATSWMRVGFLAFLLSGVTAFGQPMDGASGRLNYSWQEPQAKVLPNGNLEWAPKPFVFEKGDSVRYIDFEAGDDAKDGQTQRTAWKHHPWDVNATGESKACKGIQTYVFKGGVVYRSGPLKATESGAPGKPIRLTRDPSWGAGEAVFNGGYRIKGGWKKGNAAEAPGVPNPENVWYQDIGKKKADALWQITGDKVERLHIARWPNFEDTDPDDPLKNWPVWTAYDVNTGRFTSPALKNLGAKTCLDGVTLWTQGPFLMGAASLSGYQSGSYDPDAGSLIIPGRAKMDQFKRIPDWSTVHFMLENLPKFLDAPGEFYYDAKGSSAGRLFLLPAGGVDPNSVIFELAQIGTQISISGQHDIVISGLEFRFTDPSMPDNYGAPSVSILGNNASITVKNCKFYYVAGAVSASMHPAGGGDRHQDDPPACVLDNIIISDNDIQHSQKSGAIYLSGGRSKGEKYGQLLHVEVLRNRLIDTAFRHGTAIWSSHPAIDIHWAETAEVAGNIIDRTFGNGIITFGGKNNGSGGTVPLTRLLVHHNQIDNSMLDCNDFGGLEHFQGGPAYLYNNVTRNAVGNRVLKHELAYALYLDGGFKVYLFNNIIAGKVKPGQPDYYNYTGYFMVAGFLNPFFNNTIYHFQQAISGNSGNRCNIVGNLIQDSKNKFIMQNNPSDVSMLGGGDTGSEGRSGLPTTAYASNVFHGQPKEFGNVAGTSSKGSYAGGALVSGKTLEELSANLNAAKCRLATLGWKTEIPPLTDPTKMDYRPAANSGVKGRGVKYFVPWSLAREVGEWNFYKSASTPGIVLGEGFYMTDEYMNRDMYYFIPRNDLTVSACTPENYVSGLLEDWTEGALSFDGKRVATLSHAEMTKSMDYPEGRGKKTYDGAKRETVDMGTNSFLVEVVFKTDEAKGSLVSKLAESGYALVIAADGRASLILQAGGAKAAASSTIKVNDGKWHHVIAEADRASGKATIYVDGMATGDGKLDAVAKDATLANAADFVVGKEFVGAIDFLRVCRSTLAASKTSIDELYAWEFNGPFLRDFTGRRPLAGSRRDAGAIQTVE